jgi:hypothetical protein
MLYGPRGRGEGKVQQTHNVYNLITVSEPIVLKMWDPQHLSNIWASTASYGDSLPSFVTKLRR